jgi:hypothetical protein
MYPPARREENKPARSERQRWVCPQCGGHNAYEQGVCLGCGTIAPTEGRPLEVAQAKDSLDLYAVLSLTAAALGFFVMPAIFAPAAIILGVIAMNRPGVVLSSRSKNQAIGGIGAAICEILFALLQQLPG